MMMNTISILEKSIQNYEWGSRTAIQPLVGRPTQGDKPVAELWMGAHPKAPSRIQVDGDWVSLSDVISKDPESVLGTRVSEKFKKSLPFLFKVLAAERPLSLQVHPNKAQAREGFERENSLNIPLTASHRNYRDKNHKPEIFCALTEFKGLKGFRKPEEIHKLMERITAGALSKELGLLEKSPDVHGLKNFFSALMSMEPSRQERVIHDAIGQAETYVDEDQSYQWMVELSREYGDDIGVFSPLMLHAVNLSPGEAIFLEAGELHSYLGGMGVELMANSDNVLRGGLTTKHVDPPELLKVVNFKIAPLEKVASVARGPLERIYPTPAREFLLSRISIQEGVAYTSSDDRSVEILICVQGEGSIRDLGNGQDVALSKGVSIIIPAVVSQYRIEGEAILYKASVPVEPVAP